MPDGSDATHRARRPRELSHVPKRRVDLYAAAIDRPRENESFLITHREPLAHHGRRFPSEPTGQLPGPVLVVATNCNGGVKEVLSLPREVITREKDGPPGVDIELIVGKDLVASNK